MTSIVCHHKDHHLLLRCNYRHDVWEYVLFYLFIYFFFVRKEDYPQRAVTRGEKHCVQFHLNKFFVFTVCTFCAFVERP